MGHSQIKKSIDKIVGENRWMTAALANKMAQPKKKKKQLIIFMPLFATIAVAAIAFFLITSNETQPQLKQSNLNEANIVNYVEDTNFGEAIVSYLKTIEISNKKGIIELGRGIYNDQNVEELLSKYSNVDFSTVSLINTVPAADSRIEIYYAYLTHTSINTSSTMMHKLFVERTSDGWYVYEFPESEWISYEPFTAPEYLAFHYEPATAIDPDYSYTFKDLALASPSIPINKDMIAHFYVQDGKVAFVIQKGNDYFPVTLLDKLDSGSEPHAYGINDFQNVNNYIYYTLSSPEQAYMLTFYYNDSINKIQVLFAEPEATTFFTDVDENGIYEIFINNKTAPIVATVEVGQLVFATPEKNFAEHWNEAFLSVEYNNRVIIVTYKDVHGEKYANYTWKTVNEATYLNDNKMIKTEY